MQYPVFCMVSLAIDELLNFNLDDTKKELEIDY